MADIERVRLNESHFDDVAIRDAAAEILDLH